jgi:hypothetical protein
VVSVSHSYLTQHKYKNRGGQEHAKSGAFCPRTEYVGVSVTWFERRSCALGPFGTTRWELLSGWLGQT